jgi:hypothetical protein
MMQDNDVLAAVRESAMGLRLEVPLDEIKRRGRVVRMRRKLAGAAGITAVAVVAAVIAVTGTAPAPVARTPAVQPRLAAWTVMTGPGDTVRVTIRQLDNPGGLQRTLREDGVPARVAFGGTVMSTNAPLPPGCAAPRMSDAENAALQAKILPLDLAGPKQGIALTIHKSAIPRGVGIYLTIQNGSDQSSWGWGLDLVQATARCTG